MLAEGNQVAQQGFTIDLAPLVVNQDAAPVRLVGHQAVAFQQVTVQGFTDLLPRVRSPFEQTGLQGIAFYRNIEIIEALARQEGKFFVAKLLRTDQSDIHRPTRSSGQVLAEQRAHRLEIIETGLVE